MYQKKIKIYQLKSMYSFVEFRIHKVYLHPEAREVAFVIRVVFSSFYYVQKRQVSFDVR